jgi:hypothetical protein
MTDVRQIAVPLAVRELTTLSEVDYEEAFVVHIASADRHRTGEEWARATLERAPRRVRTQLVLGWLGLGLLLGPPVSDRFVLGWRLRRSTRDHAVLGATSLIGLRAELVFKPQGDTLLFASFMRQRTPLARAVWARIEAHHQRVVRSLLRRAARPRGAAPQDRS